MKRSLMALTAATTILSIGTLAYANAQHEHDHTRPDEHAPIGVMGGHTHKKGEWMTSYRYSRMKMKGNRDGNNNVSVAEVHADFPVAPTEMIMEMHMFGLMYGVTDNFTAMAMVPYIDKSMDHIVRNNVEFTTNSNGIGDVKLTGLYTFYQQGHHKLHFNGGFSIPTGSINQRDNTPGGFVRLPYPMQLGSGTIDFLPGITYNGHNQDWSWGSQISAVIRLEDENENDYQLGNEYRASVWGAKRLGNYISTSLRLDAIRWGNIDGADPLQDPNLVPTARTDLRGGERIDALVGMNVVIPELDNQRLAVEFGLPIYQHLDGPQLETDYRITVGWQWTF